MQTGMHGESLNKNYFNTLASILTDESFTCPALKLADYSSRSNEREVYFYSLRQRIVVSRWPNKYGSVHGDDLALLFGEAFNDPSNEEFNVSELPWSTSRKFTSGEKDLSKDIMSRWSNFIRNDDPNDNTGSKYQEKERVKWIPYTLKNDKNQSGSFLVFKNDTSYTSRVPPTNVCQLWNHLIIENLKVNKN
jgi:carboxylesterase type B